MMIESTYSISRLESEFPKQLIFKVQLSSLNNDRMSMEWLKYEIIWTKFSLQNA